MNSDAPVNNKRLVRKLLVTVLFMFGFAFMLVPLYDVMCEALGINGKTNAEAEQAPTQMVIDTSRTVRVEFMSSISPDMPWKFKPEQLVLDVHPGEVIQTAYLAENLKSAEMTGQAVPSVSPGEGATYLRKIECFCFQQQTLEGYENVTMPVVFYIEPDLPESINTLTLSYTLFPHQGEQPKVEDHSAHEHMDHLAHSTGAHHE